ncbi:uncharacterized protein BKCO1_9000142 [Diplodia corticola]|uniref:Uncharacterized protein n=1 Tax=Diplodia corticola TaxID=236234 RepID=A0A1J9R8D4_9PEZI|nr:uncharacterized protein BKCO1_9000142 [Diplodia corticola]OJD36840.1 hypothetical protein BKCO1_9000142 [Diplodia corticola]
MQILTSDESYQNLSEYGQVNGDNDTRDLAVSPTASLEPCEHCGEEYCTDAEVGVAQEVRMYRATPARISHSASSTPAKPLRKKRKLDSLVSRAKEQASRFLRFSKIERKSTYCTIVPDARLRHSSADHAMATEPANSMISTAGQKPGHEKRRELKVQIPTEDFVGRGSAHRQYANSSQADEDEPSSPFGMDPSTPERRKLDELHEGVRIVYKRKSASKSSSRLSAFLKRK